MDGCVYVLFLRTPIIAGKRSESVETLDLSPVNSHILNAVMFSTVLDTCINAPAHACQNHVHIPALSRACFPSVLLNKQLSEQKSQCQHFSLFQHMLESISSFCLWACLSVHKCERKEGQGSYWLSLKCTHICSFCSFSQLLPLFFFKAQ